MPILTALFDLNGTATRKQAFRVFVVLILGLGLGIALSKTAGGYLRFYVPIMGLITVWWWASLVRRLHDAGRTGAWALLFLVPLIGAVVSVAALFLRQHRPFNDGRAGMRSAGSLGLGFVLLFYLSRLFWQPYHVPAEHMKPTLLVNDAFAVRYADAGDLQHGDIAVFRHPVTGSDMISRLVGLPGDSVQVRAGQVFVNETALALAAEGVMQEIYAPQGALGNLPRCANAAVGVGGICDKPLFRETLPSGRSYRITNLEEGGFADNTALFTVPEGHYFFMGDNRDNSNDSRFDQGVGGFGFVPAENVIGRMKRVLFSSQGTRLWAVWDWRGDRMFRAVE
jgi:signal peptidase I